MSKLTVAPYTPGDESKILELFKLTFNKQMSPDYWNWRFASNPAGRQMIELAWDGATLAGHYAVSPVKMSINGRESLTALSMTTMTHPDYRKRGIFVTLAQSLYRRLDKEGVVGVWGFPNDNSYHGFMAKLNWFPLARIPKLQCKNCQGVVIPPDEERQDILEVYRIDNRFDELWQRIDKDNLNLVVRDSKYLQWRYLECPLNEYRVFILPESGGISGYLVLKTYCGGTESTGEIVDLLAVNNDAVRRLLKHALKHFSISGVGSVVLWMNTGASYYKSVEELGFKPLDEFTHLGAMVNGTQILPEAINDYAKWYITMGDSDVF